MIWYWWFYLSITNRSIQKLKKWEHFFVSHWNSSLKNIFASRLEKIHQWLLSDQKYSSKMNSWINFHLLNMDLKSRPTCILVEIISAMLSPILAWAVCHVSPLLLERFSRIIWMDKILNRFPNSPCMLIGWYVRLIDLSILSSIAFDRMNTKEKNDHE